jgi:hypothetical protein
MAGITVSDIISAQPLYQQSEASWADFVLGVENNAADLDSKVAVPLATAWAGTAAELAHDQVSTTQGGIISSSKQLKTIRGLVGEFADSLAKWRQQLEPLLSQARSQDLDVAEDGTVTIPLTSSQRSVAAHDPSAWSTVESTASSLQTEIQAILTRANLYDGEMAAVLRNQLPAEGGVVQTVTPWKSKYSTLSQIAQAYYGNANMWPIIWEANKDIITDPNNVITGMHLVIPAVAGQAQTTASLTPAEAALLAQANGTPATPTSPPVQLTPQERESIAIANGVSPSVLNPTPTSSATHPAGVTYTGGNPNDDSYRSSQGGESFPSTTTGTDDIQPNSQGLYLPPNATQAESNAS